MTKTAEHSTPDRGFKILGTGLLALDVILPAGQQRSAAWCMLGGTCGNVLTILSALGWQAFPVGRLDPDDPAFSFLTDEVELWGLRRDFLHVKRTSEVPIITQR